MNKLKLTADSRFIFCGKIKSNKIKSNREKLGQKIRSPFNLLLILTQLIDHLLTILLLPMPIKTQSRLLASSLRRYSTSTVSPAPVRRVGALRGGFLGFFVGVSITSAFVYKYIWDDYNTATSVVIKDVLSLSKSIRILEEHVKALEDQKQK